MNSRNAYINVGCDGTEKIVLLTWGREVTIGQPFPFKKGRYSLDELSDMLRPDGEFLQNRDPRYILPSRVAGLMMQNYMSGVYTDKTPVGVAEAIKRSFTFQGSEIYGTHRIYVSWPEDFGEIIKTLEDLKISPAEKLSLLNGAPPRNLPKQFRVVDVLRERGEGIHARSGKPNFFPLVGVKQAIQAYEQKGIPVSYNLSHDQLVKSQPLKLEEQLLKLSK